MKYILILFLALSLVSFVGQAQTSKGDAILGTYLSPKKDGKILIYKKGNLYFGKITEGKDPNRLDTKNPDESLRSRKLIGLEFLTHFKYDGDEDWVDGKIYDPDEGKTYSCKMWQEGKNLKVRGFIGISLLGRTEVFTRVE